MTLPQGRRGRRQLLLWLALGCLPVALPLCAQNGPPGHNQLSDGGHFRLWWTPDLQPLPLNLLQGWNLQLQDAAGRPLDGAVFSIDGGMPAHDHGLPTVPRITPRAGAGNYRLEGLRFHMPGIWELRVQIEQGDRRDTVRIELLL